MRAHRVIISFYLVIFAGTLATAGVFFWQTRAEYRQLREVEQRSARRLAELEQKLKDQQTVLERLRNDPSYVERVIRRQLKYAKPGEYIYRFEE